MGRTAFPIFLVALLLTVIQAPLLQGSSGPPYPPPNHGAITIIGNSGFALSDAVVSGSGSELDPYVIEGWVIDAGASHGISITGADAHFVIRNCTIYGTDEGYGIIVVNSSNAKIEGNTLISLKQGIRIDGAESSAAEGNVIRNCTGGIFIQSSTGITASNNNISGRYYGILVSQSSSVSVTENDCSGSGAYGISLQGAHLCIVSGNNCSGCASSGISVSGGSNGNTISGNDCTRNSYNGMEMYDSFMNAIEWNDCTHNGIGMLVINSSSNAFTGNNASFCGNYGMRVQSSSNNTFDRCDFSGIASGSGALLHASSDNNTFVNCSFSFSQYGIQVDGCKGVLISACRMHNNSAGGLWNYASDSAFSVLARECWWGAPSGPSGSGPGSGDKVSKNVVYYPWIGEKATAAISIRTGTAALNLTAPNSPATVTISCNLTPFITTTPVNIRVKDPDGQTTTIAVNASASKFSVNVTVNKAGNWTVLAEVPESEVLKPAASNTLSISVAAPAAAAPGGEILYAGVAIVLLIAGVSYALIRSRKGKK
ncbi:MAG: right-handed parallel beta-helix repeat-containing protein [Candidatus Methanosuratincola petrocarbonis]